MLNGAKRWIGNGTIADVIVLWARGEDGEVGGYLLEKDTPGCFLYSVADLLIYVFLDVQRVHCIPFKQVRDWFLPRGKDYPLRTTRTRTGPVCYTTVGALVPLRDVKKAVEVTVWERAKGPAPAPLG